MKNSFFNYFKSSILVTFIAVLVVILFLAKTNWHLSFAISGVISLVLIVIAKYAWNIKPFKWLFWIEDFSGRYEGILKYSYVDENGIFQSGQRKHVKIINQNGCRISVASFTIKDNGEKSSPSYSKGIFVEPTDDEHHYQLVFHYINEGNQQLGFPPHFGTDVIKFINNGKSKKLTGRYYTDRNPQTRGEYYDLKWVNNDLNHEF